MTTLAEDVLQFALAEIAHEAQNGADRDRLVRLTGIAAKASVALSEEVPRISRPPLNLDQEEVKDALFKARGNQGKAAQALGVARTTLQKHLGQKPKPPRTSPAPKPSLSGRCRIAGCPSSPFGRRLCTLHYGRVRDAIKRGHGTWSEEAFVQRACAGKFIVSPNNSPGLAGRKPGPTMPTPVPLSGKKCLLATCKKPAAGRGNYCSKPCRDRAFYLSKTT